LQAGEDDHFGEREGGVLPVVKHSAILACMHSFKRYSLTLSYTAT
jgi:hypothetical protein